MVTLYLLDSQQHPLQQWHFNHESLIRIGRSPQNDVVLNDPLVSRHHVELRLISGSNNAWQLTNKGTNGTFIDGVLVSQSPIANNSLIQLARGGPLLRFQVYAANAVGVTPRTSLSSAPKPSIPVANGCAHRGNAPQNLFCVHCGQPIVVERQIRHYQVLRTLGQGGMGTTYLAWEPGISSERPQLLVLKEMNADMARIAKAQELFEREAHTLKTLHHPGIPEYYDFFVQDGKKYLAMELIHGEDLEKQVLARGPITPANAIAWMIQTCEVLDYIHSRNPPLIHRDIKPANLMLRRADRRIVVLDFGAVKEIGTAPSTRIGAEGYAAPEQERGQPLIQSDLYAIGPTLIFLLTGETPFKFYRPRGRGYRFDIANIPTITPQLRDVIERVTEPIARDRYVNAQELAKALAACRHR